MKRVIKATVDIKDIRDDLYNELLDEELVGNPEYDFMFEDHGEGPLKARYDTAVNKWLDATAPQVAKKIENHMDDPDYMYSDEFHDYTISLLDDLMDELYDL